MIMCSFKCSRVWGFQSIHILPNFLLLNFKSKCFTLLAWKPFLNFFEWNIQQLCFLTSSLSCFGSFVYTWRLGRNYLKVLSFWLFHGMILYWIPQPHHLVRSSENQVIRGTGPLLLVGMYGIKLSYLVNQTRLTLHDSMLLLMPLILDMMFSCIIMD